jgi:hypothetical protein
LNHHTRKDIAANPVIELKPTRKNVDVDVEETFTEKELKRMFVWCEWLCSRCTEKHVARFDLVIQHRNFGNAPTIQDRNYYIKGKIKILDVAMNKATKGKGSQRIGSKIYVPLDTEVLSILEAVREYMTKYYSMIQGTLTTEIEKD